MTFASRLRQRHSARHTNVRRGMSLATPGHLTKCNGMRTIRETQPSGSFLGGTTDDGVSLPTRGLAATQRLPAATPAAGPQQA